MIKPFLTIYYLFFLFVFSLPVLADNPTDPQTINLLRQENTLLKKQVKHLKALLESGDKTYRDLSSHISKFHEELVTQNQIEVQLLKDMAGIVDKPKSRS